MERYNAIIEAMKDAIDNGPTITSNQDAKDLLESVDAQVQHAQVCLVMVQQSPG
jgi:hypothetical protein